MEGAPALCLGPGPFISGPWALGGWALGPLFLGLGPWALHFWALGPLGLVVAMRTIPEKGRVPETKHFRKFAREKSEHVDAIFGFSWKIAARGAGRCFILSHMRSNQAIFVGPNYG